MRSHKFQNSFIEYNKYMKKRLLRLKKDNYDYNGLLGNNSFINDVIKMLRYFHMDQRGSVLLPFDKIHYAIIEVSNYLNKLNSEKIRLETLNLKENIGEATVNSFIKQIFERFNEPNKISQSGGIVVASKTMHFIMPEIFIMIDKRVMESLHNVSDYYPRARDPIGWYDVLIDYHGEKLNPYPLTANWSYYIYYSAALIYSKRIIHKWCQKNNDDVNGFLKNDKLSSVPYSSRIIDKMLWSRARTLKR